MNRHFSIPISLAAISLAACSARDPISETDLGPFEFVGRWDIGRVVFVVDGQALSEEFPNVSYGSISTRVLEIDATHLTETHHYVEDGNQESYSYQPYPWVEVTERRIQVDWDNAAQSMVCDGIGLSQLTCTKTFPGSVDTDRLHANRQ